MLNTFVAGNPGSVRSSAEAIRQTGASVEDTAEGFHRSRSRSEGIWEGQAADGFRDQAGRTGKDADGLADLFGRLAQALTVFADDLDTVRARVEQAKQAAREGELTVLPNAITPPIPLAGAPAPLPNGASAADSAAHSQATAGFQAAQTLHGKQQAAYDEAQATVNEARQIERSAHTKLTEALNAASSGLGGLSQSGAWTQAATSPTNPAAAALAGAATAMDDHAANATRTTFESAVKGGPAATSAAWSTLSTAQRGDLISKFPQLVGGADGVPAVSRDQANRSLLAGQRQSLLSKLRDAQGAARSTRNVPGAHYEEHEERAEQYREALTGLDQLQQRLDQPGKYLLGIDATAHGRGHTIVASGNPDTAGHVLTCVPGTFSDLGDAMSYVDHNDHLLDRAQHFAPGQQMAAVTWSDYNSPPSLFDAASGSFAEHSEGHLAQFQDGLRASHEGPPSHNTVLGHSYGSTLVGYAARDHGLAANDIAFIGSPGVGVDHTHDLGVPGQHVWSGTAGHDIIRPLTPSLNPADIGDGANNQWFGMDPSGPHFGGQQLATDPNAGHSDYWDRKQSVDAMAKVVAGAAQGPSKP